MKHDTYQIGCFLQLLSEGVTKKELRNTCGVLASAFDDSASLAVVRGFLRTFTSEWIDSGFAKDGSEHPLLRNFAPKGRATLLAADTADGSQRLDQGTFGIPRTVQAMAKCANGQVIVVADREERKYVVRPGKGVGGYGKPPYMFIEPRGGFSYRHTVAVEQSRDCIDGTGKRTKAEHPEEYLEVVAAMLFMEFYQSECRFLLMRCRRCGVFVIPERKPRKRYEYGWYCEECRSAGTATARMLSVTKQHRQRWLRLAAEAWLRWRARYGERSVWIAEEVNKQLGRTEPRIRRNSVTHNAGIIARMAEDLGPNPVADA
jgi:hypothetical protein